MMTDQPRRPATALPLEPRFARAAVTIGVASAVTALFVFTSALPEYIDLVDIEVPGAVAFLLLGLVAIAGGIRRSLLLSVLAAGGFGIAALAQLAQLATGIEILGGDASSLALYGAWACALACICWGDRAAPVSASSTAGSDLESKES